MGQPVRGVRGIRAVEQGGESIAPVLVLNRRGTNVFRRTTRTGENGIRHVGGGPATMVRPGNGHQHCITGVSRAPQGEESVGQGAGLQRETVGRPGLPLERLRQSGKGGTARLPDGSGRGPVAQMTLEMAIETVEIQERYTKKAVQALKQEESDLAVCLKAKGEKLEALIGEIKDNRKQRKQWAARRETGWRRKADMECHSCHQKGNFARECPTNPTEDELTRYWGRLCSVKGRALECLGRTRLTVAFGTRTIEWNFIVAEIEDDEGILGNDFAMAHELMVRPYEGAVYLPDLTRAEEGNMGQRLPCTIRAVTGVRAITEETLAVRPLGSVTLAPHTVTQVNGVVPTPRVGGAVMIRPGPMGLCPVWGVVEEDRDSRIWLANVGPQPEGNEVVVMAECVTEGPGASPGDERSDGDEISGLVERAAPHLTDEEREELRTAMTARRHLFATSKGDLGRTDIVKHQINTGDQPAIKQRVRRYPAAHREEERRLVEDMLAIGIIQESSSAWSSPTVLVKRRTGRHGSASTTCNLTK